MNAKVFVEDSTGYVPGQAGIVDRGHGSVAEFGSESVGDVVVVDADFRRGEEPQSAAAEIVSEVESDLTAPEVIGNLIAQISVPVRLRLGTNRDCPYFSRNRNVSDSSKRKNRGPTEKAKSQLLP